MAIFSFYATKNVTCGEGGAIVTNRADLGDRLHSARLHGMTKGAADRFRGGRYNHWDMVCLGTKANLPDLLAALLPPQIAGIREQVKLRQAIANRYREAFRPLPVRMARVLPQCSPAEHLFPIHVAPEVRDQTIDGLNARGINVTVNYNPVHRTTYYAEKYKLAPEAFPVSLSWGEGTISVPLYPSLAREQQDLVIAAVTEVVGG
jgi:UDP-4-amino-4-deoxy-L-arabinose-oxoglutarate aminotransferase